MSRLLPMMPGGRCPRNRRHVPRVDARPRRLASRFCGPARQLVAPATVPKRPSARTRARRPRSPGNAALRGGLDAQSPAKFGFRPVQAPTHSRVGIHQPDGRLTWTSLPSSPNGEDSCRRASLLTRLPSKSRHDASSRNARDPPRSPPTGSRPSRANPPEFGARSPASAGGRLW